MTPRQRASQSCEFSLDALLRGNIKDRFEVYARAVQNGIMTRNEARQLENLPADESAGRLTAQSNLVPLDMLGQTANGGADVDTEDVVAQ
jgi:phage portal protein BeeE